MASQVDICNKALSILGAARIVAITDASKSARAMSAHWDMVRQAELRKRFWSFALTRTQLPALANTPSWGFGTAYALPADFLRLHQVNDSFAVPAQTDYRTQDDSAWALETITDATGNWVRAILTDFGAPLKIRYVRDVTDCATFDPLFADVLAAKLAFDACEEITNSTSKQQAAQQRYDTAVKEAARCGAIRSTR